MLLLELFHFRVEISDKSNNLQHVLDWLEDDFRDFPRDRETTGKRFFKIEIGEFAVEPKIFWFAKPSVLVFGWGGKKNYHYDNEVQLSVDYSYNRRAQIWGRSECVYEILYLLILSTIGEWMEQEGWVRLHGLSFLRQKRASVMIAPQGFGKSYLAQRMITEGKEFTVLGDELVNYKDGEIVGVPLRLAERNSNQQHLRYTYRKGVRHKQISEHRLQPSAPTTLDKILLVNCSWLSIVIGEGLPQMLEYRWRLDGIPGLCKMLWNRWVFILQNKFNTLRTARLDLQDLRDILDS